MKSTWVELSKTGRLLYVHYYPKSGIINRYAKKKEEKLSSIIKYEDGMITVLTKAGELKTIPANIGMSNYEIQLAYKTVKEYTDINMLEYSEGHSMQLYHGFFCDAGMLNAFTKIKEYQCNGDPHVILDDGTRIDSSKLGRIRDTYKEYYC